MSACTMLNYNDVTLTAWQNGIKIAATYGVTVAADAGSATVSGFTVAWNYDPAAKSLSVQCTGKPIWVPCWLVNGKLNDTVESCLNQEKIEMARTVPG
jgi:hypothetical protein